MKTLWIALFVSVLSLNTFGQKMSSASEWEISLGRSWGRVHENIVRQTIDSTGRITYLNKRNGTPAVEQISKQDVDEIAGLLNRLNLPRVKNIPSKEFNRCIVSPHLPNVYFSLSQGKEYALSHCNNSADTKYEYTLILSVAQKAIYERLRAKLESLVGDEIKK
jgi:hypothetical protein